MAAIGEICCADEDKQRQKTRVERVKLEMGNFMGTILFYVEPIHT